jgi:O-antigen ligase
MAQQKFSFQLPRSQSFSLAIISTLLILCILLILGQIFLFPLNPLFVLIGIAALLIVMLFMLSKLALPLYILVAGPSIALSASDSGILSRLYIGDLLFVLIVGAWLLLVISPKRKIGLVRRDTPLLIPLIGLVLIALFSIIYSHMFPDPLVSYSFAHSDVPLLLVNVVEMSLLISLPLFILIVPTMVRTLRDARWMIGAYLVIGLPYALGTIFAGPLGLYSNQVILGVQRPQVFGADSSNLGRLDVLFACLSLCMALWSKKGSSRQAFGLLTCLYAAGVVMSFGRESWIGLLLAVWIIFYLRFKSPIALLFPLVILPFMYIIFPDVFNFFNPTKVYGADRITIWQDAITIWQHSPYLGVGAGNFQFFDLTFGTEVAGVAHNQFLAVLAEMGVQGLACLLLALIMIGRTALKRYNTAISSIGKAISLAYLGYFAALLFATFFTDSFIPSTAAAGGTGPFILMSYSWLFLGLVLSIPNWDREAADLDPPVTIPERVKITMK